VGLTVKEILAEHYLLRHMPAADLDRLAGFARSRSCQPNEPVFVKGDPAAGMMAVVEGRVRIVTYSAEGKEIVLNVINPGEVFGEIALIDGGERTADAVAMEPTELLILERRDFLPYLERNPELCIKLLIMVCERIRATSEQIEDFSFLDLKARLAKRLIALTNSHGVPADEGTRIDMRLSQRELAAMMGTSREAVNKQLRAWQEDGLILLKRGSVTVVDLDRLEDVFIDGS
jgi:CRP/FNR family transcriptional regulator, cyclic AMP receptor protein